MKSWFLIVAIVLIAAQPIGVGQSASPYQTFAELGSMSCLSWKPSPASGSDFHREERLKQAPAHAWVYGYLAGAGNMPSRGSAERMTQIDSRPVDAWMDRYCAQHRGDTIEGALKAMTREFGLVRNTR